MSGDKEIDHEFTDEVVCPYCGYEYSDSYEFDNGGEIECDNCEETFSYTRNITIDYCTKRKEAPQNTEEKTGASPSSSTTPASKQTGAD